MNTVKISSRQGYTHAWTSAVPANSLALRAGGLLGTREFAVSLPVFLIAEDPACHRTIAGLSVLDRLVITAHRAGAESITLVCAGERPKLARAEALGIAVNWAGGMPPLEECALVASGQLVVQLPDFKKVLTEGGRLYSETREPLPCGYVAVWKISLEDSLPDRPRVFAQGVACVVKNGLSAAQAEDALWDTMGSPTDGLVDTHFNRPLGRPFSRLLIHTRISPNLVSIFGTLLGVFAAYCFTLGLPQWMILGAVLLQLSAVAGCIDGDLARMGFKETAIGKWIEFGGNQMVRLCLFAGLGVGVYKLNDNSGPALWLGLSAAVGTVIFFVVMLRANLRLQPFIHKTANRDFSVLLLALAIAQRVDWFLWLAAIGVHLFWITALWMQRRNDAEAGV